MTPVGHAAPPFAKAAGGEANGPNAFAAPSGAMAVNAPLADASGPESAEGGMEEGEVAPWPSSSEEAAFLSGSPEEAAVPAAVPNASAAEAKPAERLPPIPPLEELVKRVPDSVKELLDDLFRAKFTTVRRL